MTSTIVTLTNNAFSPSIELSASPPNHSSLSSQFIPSRYYHYLSNVTKKDARWHTILFSLFYEQCGTGLLLKQDGRRFHQIIIIALLPPPIHYSLSAMPSSQYIVYVILLRCGTHRWHTSSQHHIISCYISSTNDVALDRF